MKTGVRKPDQFFPDDEKLFRRFRRSHRDKHSKLKLSEIPLPDLSVNRQHAEGQPEDVIISYPGWGVLGITVDRLPREILDNGIPFRFDPVHCPEADNWYHSEIQSFDAEAKHRDKSNPLPFTVDLRWRKIFRDRLDVIVKPKS